MREKVGRLARGLWRVHILSHGRENLRESNSLRGRRLKGKGKGVWGARVTRWAHQEGGREGEKRLPGNHCFRHPAY